MNPEDKKILSEAISKGITDGFWTPTGQVLSGIIIGVLILIVVWIGLVLYSDYQKEQCIESGECPRVVAVGLPDPIGTIHCYVYVGNTTSVKKIMDFKAIGYVEANAKYEQLKPEINEWLKKDNSSLSLKYINCN